MDDRAPWFVRRFLVFAFSLSFAFAGVPDAIALPEDGSPDWGLLILTAGEQGAAGIEFILESTYETEHEPGQSPMDGFGWKAPDEVWVMSFGLPQPPQRCVVTTQEMGSIHRCVDSGFTGHSYWSAEYQRYEEALEPGEQIARLRFITSGRFTRFEVTRVSADQGSVTVRLEQGSGARTVPLVTTQDEGTAAQIDEHAAGWVQRSFLAEDGIVGAVGGQGLCVCAIDWVDPRGRRGEWHFGTEEQIFDGAAPIPWFAGPEGEWDLAWRGVWASSNDAFVSYAPLGELYEVFDLPEP